MKNRERVPASNEKIYEGGVEGGTGVEGGVGVQGPERVGGTADGDGRPERGGGG